MPSRDSCRAAAIRATSVQFVSCSCPHRTYRLFVRYHSP